MMATNPAIVAAELLEEMCLNTDEDAVTEAAMFCEIKVVDCWLCGGESTARTCRCHSHPPGIPAKPCDMVCNE